MNDYMVWGSRFREFEDWCPISAYLKTKKAGSEKLSVQTVDNMLKHHFYVQLYINKWDALRNYTTIEPEKLASSTISKVPAVVKAEWQSTVQPALNNEGVEMSLDGYTKRFMKTVNTEQLRRVCERVSRTIERRVADFEPRQTYINFIAECNDWDVLKYPEAGIGSRPDFILAIGEHIVVMDVKSKVSHGAELQNVVSYLVVARNYERIAKKLGMTLPEQKSQDFFEKSWDEKTPVSPNTFFEEYSTGFEREYMVNKFDKTKVGTIVDAIRRDGIPEKKKVCSSKKQTSCGLCSDCNKHYGSIDELLKKSSE